MKAHQDNTLMQSNKLAYLIRHLWKSPVFGDSFPKDMDEKSALAQFEAIYPHFVQTIRPILKKGLPDTSEEEMNGLIREIAPKSIAFCASTSAGEVQSVEQLSDAAVAIALSYWADQSMDRGDEWMLAAVQYLNHKSISSKKLASEELQNRLEALRYIQRLAGRITLPEDFPYVQQAIERDALGNQAEMKIFSRQYSSSEEANFWQIRAEEVAKTMIDCSGLLSAVSGIYAIYRRRRPELPSLNAIYSHPLLMQLVRGTINPAVRIFDDAGDCYIDMGKDASMGEFNLNIFNQPASALLEAFLDYSEIPDGHPLREKLLSAFGLSLSERRIAVSGIYLALMRDRLTKFSSELWDEYRTFLTLCKRTLEAGFVNIIGDAFLAEDIPLQEHELELFNLVMPNIDSHSL